MDDDEEGEIRCGAFHPIARELEAHLASMKRADHPAAWIAFGEFLKEERLLRRISLRVMAERCGMEPADYSVMEHGWMRPPMDFLHLMTALRGVPRSPSWNILLELWEEARAAEGE